jgi:hypothetical protein
MRTFVLVHSLTGGTHGHATSGTPDPLNAHEIKLNSSDNHINEPRRAARPQ